MKEEKTGSGRTGVQAELAAWISERAKPLKGVREGPPRALVRRYCRNRLPFGTDKLFRPESARDYSQANEHLAVEAKRNDRMRAWVPHSSPDEQ